MNTKTPVRLSMNVSSEFRDELKNQANAHGKTLTDYVLDALKDQIQRDSINEDRIWGEMSEKAKQEPILSFESSTNLLHRMKNA